MLELRFTQVYIFRQKIVSIVEGLVVVVSRDNFFLSYFAVFELFSLLLHFWKNGL